MNELTPEDLAARDLAELDALDRPLTRAERQAKRERELQAARAAIRLDPEAWRPPVLHEPPRRDPVYRAYREADRRFRRAFGRQGSAGGRRQQMRSAHGLAHFVESREQS